ncbi:MAG: hypothetical protein AAF517_02640 [Planctomycetota bacterium]
MSLRVRCVLIAALLWQVPGQTADLIDLGPGFPIDGLCRESPATTVRLTPDASAVLYFQGDPWPRLMIRDAKPGGVAKPISSHVPITSLPPQVSADGATVYFTATPRVEAPRADEAYGVGVFAADLASGTVKKLHPSRTRDDRFTLLLDFDAKRSRLLIATGTAFSGRVHEIPNRAVQLLELDPKTGRTVDLSARARAASFARYAPSGGIEWTEKAASAGSEVLRRESAKGTVERTGQPARAVSSRRGDRFVASTRVPHRGSFGFDPHVAWNLDGDTLRPPKEVHAASVRWAPHDIRGDRVLISWGTPERRRFGVATVQSVKGPSAQLSPATRLQHPAEFLSANESPKSALARAPATTKELLNACRKSIRGGATEGPSGVRVEYRQSAIDGSNPVPIVVTEDRSGRIRLDHRFELGGDAEPLVQSYAFDGKQTWFRDESGAIQSDETVLVVQDLDVFSPLRMLFDPSASGDTNLSFGEPKDEAVPARTEPPRRPRLTVPPPKKTPPANETKTESETDDRKRWAIPFSYADGYRGELIVERTGETTRPVAIRSRRYVESNPDGLRVSTKLVSFGDWKPNGDWVLPRSIRYEFGSSSFRVEVTKIEILSAVDDKVFARPTGD